MIPITANVNNLAPRLRINDLVGSSSALASAMASLTTCSATSPASQGGDGQAGTCGCTATTCAAQGKNCGQIDDECGGTLTCGACGNPAPVCADNVCTACGSHAQCGSDAVCCSGSCFSGVCCSSGQCDDPGAPDCVSHDCVCAKNTDTPCASGETCCGSGCADLQHDSANCGSCGHTCGSGQTCQGGECGVVCGNDFCVAGEVCLDGACQACNVTCTGTPTQCGAALQAAFNGATATLLVCPGVYRGGFTINRTVTVVGSGQGDDPATNTILDGNQANAVLLVDNNGNATLSKMRLQRGKNASGYGGGVGHVGNNLSMTDCTITDCVAARGGGVYYIELLRMTRCTVSSNRATEGGGGIAGTLASALGTLTNCQVTNNQTDGLGGGIGLFGLAGLYLDGNTEVGHNTAASGGGVYASASYLTIGASCRVTENTADAGQGGGVFQEGSYAVSLIGPDPSPIITNNCHENCVGNVPKCQSGGTCPT